jgi:predicted RNase H-like nuclease
MNAAGTVIVGIDCATQPDRVGLSRVEVSNGAATLTHVLPGDRVPTMEDQVVEWLQGSVRGLIALDAPLGWPAALADALPLHRAGARLKGEADRLFHRETDDRVRALTGKNPLEVGADLIARTAHAALDLLGRISDRLGAEVPLAWSCDLPAGVHAIEVYPAATLTMHGLPANRYKDAKKPDHEEQRRKIVSGVGLCIDLGPNRAALWNDSDQLDAVLCALAAIDFLSDSCLAPEEAPLVRKEGWIWVRRERAPS